jgi:hypothetical protein
VAGTWGRVPAGAPSDRAAGLREEVEALGHRKAARSCRGGASTVPRAVEKLMSVDVVEMTTDRQRAASMRRMPCKANAIAWETPVVACLRLSAP